MRWRGILAWGTAVVSALLLLPSMAQTIMVDDDTSAVKERAQSAIEKGVNYLRRVQARGGAFPYRANSDANSREVVGATALCGVALLECGVPPNDPVVQNAASFVRRGADGPRAHFNYSVCLSIMFLDRLSRGTGKTNDAGLIRRLTGMVVQGQAPNGGWGYELTPDNAQSDNSNTQFGVVALWIARKYGVRGVENAIAKAAQKFRRSQQEDGTWKYDSTEPLGITPIPSTPAMTCAGVLGLALQAGMERQLQESNFRAQGRNTGEAGDVVVNLNNDPAVAKARENLANVLNSVQQSRSTVLRHEPYFWWSLERVCKLYRWKKINNVNWFAIGVDRIVPLQKPDGSWGMDFMASPTVDTGFCLLFLSESNLLGPLEQAEFRQGAITGGAPVTPAPPKMPAKAQSPQQLAKDLAKKLLNATPAERAAILEEFDLSRGSDYSYELAKTIPQLGTPTAQEGAREILVRRIMRQSVPILTGYIKEDDRELRWAATRAAGLKSDKEAVPVLIPLLEDRDPTIQDAALNGLKSLSGQNFGKSVERWSRWYQTTQKSSPP